jgi:microcystin-dependent protein
MSDPFLGEIKMFGGNFAPVGYALCDGQLLSVAQNSALFSLLGARYGGNGETTFGLPDMRGRVPVHQGTGPGLSTRNIGSRSGAERVTLVANQLPSHSHNAQVVSTREANSSNPVGNVPARPTTNSAFAPASTNRISGNTENAGGGQAHNNMPPYQCIHFIIALTGVFPS